MKSAEYGWQLSSAFIASAGCLRSQFWSPRQGRDLALAFNRDYGRLSAVRTSWADRCRMRQGIPDRKRDYLGRTAGGAGGAPLQHACPNRETGWSLIAQAEVGLVVPKPLCETACCG